jgi:hypothetical protein
MPGKGAGKDLGTATSSLFDERRHDRPFSQPFDKLRPILGASCGLIEGENAKLQ